MHKIIVRLPQNMPNTYLAMFTMELGFPQKALSTTIMFIRDLGEIINFDK